MDTSDYIQCPHCQRRSKWLCYWYWWKLRWQWRWQWRWTYVCAGLQRLQRSGTFQSAKTSRAIKSASLGSTHPDLWSWSLILILDPDLSCWSMILQRHQEHQEGLVRAQPRLKLEQSEWRTFQVSTNERVAPSLAQPIRKQCIPNSWTVKFLIDIHKRTVNIWKYQFTDVKFKTNFNQDIFFRNPS